MTLAGLGHSRDRVAAGPGGLSMELARRARTACDRVLDHAVARDFAGHDPYDGLAARLPGMALLRGSRLGRLALIQAVRRSRLDLRPLLRIPPLVNPKTLGLLMSACCDLHRATGEERYRALYEQMAARALELASPGWAGVCWGYPFDWQARAFYLPAGTPTVVCTAFVARGYLDGHETFGHRDGLEIAWSACRFILHDLARTPGRRGFAFSYSPMDRSVVHNASALGAAHLARVAALAGDESLLPPAREAIQHLVDHQRPDGSWVYGLARHHQWVDTVHTGYVLDALRRAEEMLALPEIASVRAMGLRFFREALLRPGPLPRERAHLPAGAVEAHTLATAIMTCWRENLREEGLRLVTLGLDGQGKHGASSASRLFPDRYTLKGSVHQAREGFLRWTQAWMARALAEVCRP